MAEGAAVRLCAPRAPPPPPTRLCTPALSLCGRQTPGQLSMSNVQRCALHALLSAYKSRRSGPHVQLLPLQAQCVKAQT